MFNLIEIIIYVDGQTAFAHNSALYIIHHSEKKIKRKKMFFAYIFHIFGKKLIKGLFFTMKLCEKIRQFIGEDRKKDCRSSPLVI